MSNTPTQSSNHAANKGHSSNSSNSSSSRSRSRPHSGGGGGSNGQAAAAPPPPLSNHRPMATLSMKTRLASRASSFKDGLLEAFGHHHHTPPLSAGPLVGGGSRGSPASKPAISLAKKTNSTDNLIGYTEPKQNTDGLVRDVQLSLRYFEDAVAKGTLEHLPGCASVVLERVTSIQSYVFYETDMKNNAELTEIMAQLYQAISNLTVWADTVIVQGTVDHSGEVDYRDNLIEPVRRAVILLVNKLNGIDSPIPGGPGSGHKHLLQSSLSLSHRSKIHNSLPDISSPDHDEETSGGGSDAMAMFNGRGGGGDQRTANMAASMAPPPPLPPKHTKQEPPPNVDWFSNPLFDQRGGGTTSRSAAPASAGVVGGRRGSKPSTPLRFTYDLDSFSDLPSPHGLDTTLPDTTSFPYADDSVTSPNDYSCATTTTGTPPEKLLPPNHGLDESDFSCEPPVNHPQPDQQHHHHQQQLLRKIIQGGQQQQQQPPPPLSISSYGSTAQSARDSTNPMPPALPRKEHSRRKKSQYDNVWSGEGGGGVGGVSGASMAKVPHNILTSSQSCDFGNNHPLMSNVHGFFPSFNHHPLHHQLHEAALSPPPTLNTPSSGVGVISPRGLTSRRSSDSAHCGSANGPPPPLPPKKRDIINYMEMLGQSLLPSRDDLMQSLAQTQMLLQNVWADNYHEFGEFVPDNNAFNFPVTEGLFTRNIDLSRLPPVGMPLRFPDIIDDHNPPPALPPKKNRSSPSSSQYHSTSSSLHHSPHSSHYQQQQQQYCNHSKQQQQQHSERIIPIVRESDGQIILPYGNNNVSTMPSGPAGPPPSSSSCGVGSKRFSSESVASSSNSIQSADSGGTTAPPSLTSSMGSETGGSRRNRQPSPSPSSSSSLNPPPTPGSTNSVPTPPSFMSSATTNTTNATITGLALNSKKPTIKDCGLQVAEDSPLNRLNWKNRDSLIYINNSEGILELRAGDADELIILATQSTNRDFVYQDAFLLTYRTFITTLSLLQKLQFRFRRFNQNPDDSIQLRAARSSFSLMVRVVDSLVDCDFQEAQVIKNLSDFIAELVSEGDLCLARALRTKFIQKYEEHRTRLLPDLDFGRISVNGKQHSLLHFKSLDLAEQITLMDAQYFWKLDPTELLLWVKEQNEEKSPNLVKFTKHFNAMSFWCRTRILQESDPKERERLVMKFIKVMKFLRKHNNFNSYLAFLSALDSASIRRLDWSKNIVDTIKEYSAIIDFTGSFKAYREALAHSRPPLIPYMGLVLQDLTFVHIGNSDMVKGKVNFAKRWQQYNIMANIRRFKRQQYSFQRREDVIQSFGNFENALPENDLWDLSEKLKPRVRTSPTKFLLDVEQSPTGSNHLTAGP